MQGCRHPGSAKLEGRWKGLRAEGVGTDVLPSANAFAAASEILVRGDEITFSTPSARNVRATYVVDKEDASSVILHTDKDSTSETFDFKDAKTLSWRVDDKRSIIFKKVD